MKCIFQAGLMLADVFMQESYYQPLVKKGKIKEEDLDLYVFVSKPLVGAVILKL